MVRIGPRNYIGPSPEEDRKNGNVAKVQSLTERREIADRRRARRERIKTTVDGVVKTCGAAAALGCLGLTLLAGLTGVGLLWTLFTWAWGL